jgi:hypothetical protein
MTILQFGNTEMPLRRGNSCSDFKTPSEVIFDWDRAPPVFLNSENPTADRAGQILLKSGSLVIFHPHAMHTPTFPSEHIFTKIESYKEPIVHTF